MDKKTYLLRVSGSISPAKQKEFEQTIRFVFNMLPSGCLSSNLTRDVFNPNQYHVSFLWEANEELEVFTVSDEFNLTKSSFQTLGTFDKCLVAQFVDA